jgi:hypothetical protein
MIEAYTHWNAIKERLTQELAEEKEEFLVANDLVGHFIDCVREVLSVSLFE